MVFKVVILKQYAITINREPVKRSKLHHDGGTIICKSPQFVLTLWNKNEYIRSGCDKLLRSFVDFFF